MAFGRTLSLRRKLPLLVSALSVGALVVTGALAYFEVRGSAVAAAEARLESLRLEFVPLLQTTVRNRRQLEDRVAASPAVRAVLQGSPPDTAALIPLFQSLRTASDGDLPVSILDADGEVLFSTGTPPMGLDPAPEPPLDSVPTQGPFRQLGDMILFWSSHPVAGRDGAPLGWLVQRRRIAQSQTGGTLSSMIGQGIIVSLGQPNDSVWVDLGGGLVQGPPERVDLDEPFTYRGRDGTERLAVASTLDPSPWILALQMPTERMMARPRVFMTRGLGVGALLLLLIVVASWRGSRSLTDPLENLARAADGLAAGDYQRRVPAEDGNDELARLSRAFNTMTEQVARSDEALRHQLDEARALATRLEEANIRAERAREEAQAASRAKSEFLATMSHEIRTPINAVIGYTELMRSGVPDEPTPRQEEYLKRIERSSRVLISVVNDVLDFARIESGQMRVETGVGSAPEAMLAAAAALEPEAQRKGVTLTTHCKDAENFVGDAHRVHQILLNLVSNAVKFTHQGGKVTMSCALDAQGPPGSAPGSPPKHASWLRFDVEDTGIGIDADQIHRMFEPFVQGEVGFTRGHSGTGLGLAISRRLASLMGGLITAESERGKGSRFTLWLESAVPGERAATA